MNELTIEKNNTTLSQLELTQIQLENKHLEEQVLELTGKMEKMEKEKEEA